MPILRTTEPQKGNIWGSCKALKSRLLNNCFSTDASLRKEVTMLYICSGCGHKSSSASSGSCSKTDSGYHVYISESADGYICSGCGHTSHSASGGNCSKTESGYHVYIGKHGGGYICRDCGHKSSSASGGSCNKSSSGFHQYI